MTVLVVCEKPSVAADVARAMSAGRSFEKQPWGLSSPDMLVAAAAGHLVAELPPERYDERYKKWSFADLPVLPERFLYEPRDERAGTRLRQIADLMRRADVTEIVNACDAGREGELIFKLILQYAKVSPAKKVSRAWFSSMTAQAIQDAFANLRPDTEMLPLEYAARSRAEADWLVGMNATRAATCSLGGERQMLSMGRVQTPTLALVVRRDLEIENFVPEDYFQIRGTFAKDHADAAKPFQGWWRASRENDAADRFSDRGPAEEIASRAGACQTATVVDVQTREENVAPPRLFDLTDLQREANKRYGMTAARTLEAAQALYETHKYLSYPRTDSRYITADMAASIPAVVRRVRATSPDLLAAADAVLAACNPHVIVNDAKVSDHHGIIPTDAPHDLTKLSTDEARVYDLVARRLLAALLPHQRLERTTAWLSAPADGGEILFRAAGRVELEPGWRIAWFAEEPKKPSGKAKDTAAEDEEEGEDDSSDGVLPPLAAGETVRITAVTVVDRQTKAPPRFNEASLLGAMATSGRLVTDEEAAEAMKDSGLGTPATRAATLERLVKVEYLERHGRQLRASAKGRGLVLALGSHPLVSPDLTGEWEKRLRVMERMTAQDAEQAREGFSRDVRSFTSEIVGGFSSMTPDMLRAGRRVIAPCPVPACAGSVIEGPRGWGCDSWRSKDEPGCGFAVWKTQNGKRVSEKDLTKRIADVREGRVQISPPVPKVVLGPCPLCAKDVVERRASWGCSSWRSPKETGCGYVIWKKDPDGSEVDEARARDMLALGRSNAREKPPAFAACPRCSGSIIERQKSYSCDSWSPTKKGCGTVVWKVQAGHELTHEEALAQLEAMRGTKAPPAKKRGNKR